MRFSPCNRGALPCVWEGAHQSKPLDDSCHYRINWKSLHIFTRGQSVIPAYYCMSKNLNQTAKCTFHMHTLFLCCDDRHQKDSSSNICEGWGCNNFSSLPILTIEVTWSVCGFTRQVPCASQC